MGKRAASWLLIAASLGWAGCGDPRVIGEACFETSECGGGARCIATTAGNFCLLSCEAGDVFCELGGACVQSEEDPTAFVCLADGPLDKTDACTASIECELGAVCVCESTGVICSGPDIVADCEQLCDPNQGTGVACPGNDVCLPFENDANRGFCIDPT